MKCMLLYYSGAGNTEYISILLERLMAVKGDFVSRKRITAENLASLDNGADVVGIGFPIYFADAPELVYEAIRRLDGHGRSAFLFCTKGIYAGDGMRNVVRLARKRGFVPKVAREFIMPGTDALLLLAKKGSFLQRFFMSVRSRKLRLKMEDFVSRIRKGDVTSLPRPRRWRDRVVLGFWESVERVTGIDSYNAYVKDFYSEGDLCTRCGLCVSGCARNNIELTDTGIVFGDNCDTCFRCVHRCPVEAIQIGKRTKNTVRYRPLEELSLNLPKVPASDEKASRA